MSDSLRYMWRLRPAAWMDDSAFDALLALYETEATAADTIAILVYENVNYGYYPLDRLAADLDVYKKRAASFRAQGKSVGINVWPTFGMGHNNKPPDCPVAPADFDHMISYDGKASSGSFCPLSPPFIKHVQTRYKMYAEAKPGFIWIDDDMRLTHIEGSPLTDIVTEYPCFCPRCVAGFDGGSYDSREELVAALNAPSNKELRKKWCDWGSERLTRFCAHIREAVDSVDANMPLPFMSTGHTHSTFSGDYLKRCTEVLRSPMLRPGHGFYSDETPSKLFWKAMEVGRQVRESADCVTEFVWEEDSWPDVTLHKAARTRLHETLLMLTMGGQGSAFLYMSGTSSPSPLSFKEYEDNFKQLAVARPIFQNYLYFANDLEYPGGFWPLDSPYMLAAMDCTDGWFKEHIPNMGYDIDKSEIVVQFGIPITPFSDTACGTILTGRTLDSQSDSELLTLLKGNVMMDWEALAALEARGFGAYTGVKLGAKHVYSYETATNHEFNGPFSGFNRYTYTAAYDLDALDSTVESLAHSTDAYEVKHGCCISKYENSLGGKVVVFGYSPWNYIGCPAKMWQLKQIAWWMGTPAVLRFAKEYAVSRVAMFVRGNSKKAAVTLINASLDPSTPFEVLIRGDMTTARILNTDGYDAQATVRRENGVLAVTVPQMQPWREYIILAQ